MEGGPAEAFLGVGDRRVSEDVDTQDMGLVEKSTKRLQDIMDYLDVVKVKAKVGVPGRRARIVVVCDQETFNLVHKAMKQFPAKYRWFTP